MAGCSADPALPQRRENSISLRRGLLKTFPKNHLVLSEVVKRHKDNTLMIIEKQIFAGIVFSVRMSDWISLCPW